MPWAAAKTQIILEYFILEDWQYTKTLLLLLKDKRFYFAELKSVKFTLRVQPSACHRPGAAALQQKERIHHCFIIIEDHLRW